MIESARVSSHIVGGVLTPLLSKKLLLEHGVQKGTRSQDFGWNITKSDVPTATYRRNFHSTLRPAVGDTVLCVFDIMGQRLINAYINN